MKQMGRKKVRWHMNHHILQLQGFEMHPGVHGVGDSHSRWKTRNCRRKKCDAWKINTILMDMQNVKKSYRGQSGSSVPSKKDTDSWESGSVSHWSLTVQVFPASHLVLHINLQCLVVNAHTLAELLGWKGALLSLQTECWHLVIMSCCQLPY